MPWKYVRNATILTCMYLSASMMTCITVLFPHKRKFYHFESGLPVKKIFACVKVIVEKAGKTTLQSETAFGMVFHVKHKGLYSGIHVDIYTVLANVHLVEIRHGQGDTILFYKFMDAIEPIVFRELSIKHQGPGRTILDSDNNRSASPAAAAASAASADVAAGVPDLPPSV